MRTLQPKWMRLRAVALVISCFILLNACKIDDGVNVVKPDVTFYGLTDGNQLLKINARNSAADMATVPVTGLPNGESLLAIDFRPATGQLYGVSTGSRLYGIDTQTGAARALGASAFTPNLEGSSVGFDFNPTVDRIRLVTDRGQNLRLNPETGTVAATDGNINGGENPAISAVAYTENRAGATTTILYDIDPATDKLYKQDPPNAGTLVEVGALDVDVSTVAGFDISADGTIALAALTVNGKSELFRIDLTTGKATRLGKLGKNLIGLAIPTDPVAYAVDGSGNLLIFNPAKPDPVSRPITGLQSGESILGLDMRPVNGQLYALGSSSRLYTINASSGAAAAVGTAPFEPALAGSSFGFDFNPTVDRIRVVSNQGQNLRLNPETGTVAAIDGNLNPGMPMITAVAYTENRAGATTTILYDIDPATDKLYKQDPPNAGTLVEVGALGVDITTAAGFDIGGKSGTAYALLTSRETTKLYTVNLQNGAVKPVADFTASVRALAVGLGF